MVQSRKVGKLRLDSTSSRRVTVGAAFEYGRAEVCVAVVVAGGESEKS